MSGDTTLFSPPPVPLGTVASIRALMRDPLTFWPQELYDGETALHSRFAGNSYVDTSRPDDVTAVLLDRRDCFARSRFVKAMLAPAMGDGLIVADGESWRHQRSVAAPAFRQSALDALVPVFDRAALRAVGTMGTGGDRPVMPVLMSATLDIIVESLFGDAEFDREGVTRDVGAFLDVMGSPHILDLLGLPAWLPRIGRGEGVAAARRMRAVSAQILESKRAAPGEDGSMTAHLLRATDPETGARLSDEAIIDNIITFVGAGHETTSVGLAWTLWLLAHRPEWQERLLAESDGLDGPIGPDTLPNLALHTRVFQESMRLFPPVVAVGRQVIAPVHIGGVDLGPGDHVNLIAVAMHRNPAHWPDPDRFDPDRFLPEAVKARHRHAYLPFGGGATMCIGWKLALMEATVLLTRIVRAFAIAPVAGAPPPVPKVRVTMRPDDGMRLSLTPRLDRTVFGT